MPDKKYGWRHQQVRERMRQVDAGLAGARPVVVGLRSSREPPASSWMLASCRRPPRRRRSSAPRTGWYWMRDREKRARSPNAQRSRRAMTWISMFVARRIRRFTNDSKTNR